MRKSIRFFSLASMAGGLIMLAACGSGQPASHSAAVQSATPPSATAVVSDLTSQGVPLSNVVTMTAATDPNHLLGRPHQYVSAMTWDDSRVQVATTDWAGKVETFASDQDMQARAKYLATISSSVSLFAEYEYESAKGHFIVRLNKALTPDQTAKYFTALKFRWPDVEANGQ